MSARAEALPLLRLETGEALDAAIRLLFENSSKYTEIYVHKNFVENVSLSISSVKD